MVWKFEIHGEDDKKVSAKLEYNWDTDEYHMWIMPNIDLEHDKIPAMVMSAVVTGRTELDDNLCRKFIRDRVIPCNRQNIGTILRELGLPYYHECFMLKYFPEATIDLAHIELVDDGGVEIPPTGDWKGC